MIQKPYTRAAEHHVRDTDEKRKIIVCDLDGTLADCQHRVYHIIPNMREERDVNGVAVNPLKKDWDAFFDACDGDAPIPHIIDLVNAIDRSKYEVWITSGRSAVCQQKTIEWLTRHGVNYDRLIMRNAGDNTDDDILKPSWLEDGTIPRDRVAFALDDRNRVVDGWRRAGIPCLQVAEGNF